MKKFGFLRALAVFAVASFLISACSTAEKPPMPPMDPSRYPDHAEFFDHQLEVLKSRRVPDDILNEFRAQREAVLAKAKTSVFAEGHIPFLPIIPLGYKGMSADKQMWMIRGRNYIDPQLYLDTAPTP